MRGNGHFTDHVQVVHDRNVAHDQKILIIEKFEQKIDFGEKYMSYFAYACKMQCLLNLVLENSEYLWFYSTFCIVILDYCLKLHKLSNHTLVILQK